jgi:hypothetical protein
MASGRLQNPQRRTDLEAVHRREKATYNQNAHIRAFLSQILCCVMPGHSFNVSTSNQDRRPPSHEDVHTFLRTLDQDEAIRVDVGRAEVADELIKAALALRADWENKFTRSVVEASAAER